MTRHLIRVLGHGANAWLASEAVNCEEFRAYREATGQPTPLGRAVPPCDAVTEVSQVEAVSFCEWLGGQEGRAYRLPSIAELSELASEAALEGISPEVWPHYHESRPELRGGMHERYLCEWTRETEKMTQAETGIVRVLGSVFYPPWLRQGPNATHAQAFLLATTGHSFITFRIACTCETSGTDLRSNAAW